MYNDNLLAINNSKIARSDTDAGYHDVYISLCYYIIFFLLNYTGKNNFLLLKFFFPATSKNCKFNDCKFT